MVNEYIKPYIQDLYNEGLKERFERNECASLEKMYEKIEEELKANLVRCDSISDKEREAQEFLKSLQEMIKHETTKD